MRSRRPSRSGVSTRAEVEEGLSFEAGVGHSGAVFLSLDPEQQQAARAEAHRRLGAPQGGLEIIDVTDPAAVARMAAPSSTGRSGHSVPPSTR